MDAFVAWLQSTALSQTIVSRLWIWPACESLHFAGLTLVLGIAGFFDLRLLGFFRRVPVVAAAIDLMPFALVGFLVNLVTGAVFLIGHPEQFAYNLAWWFKVASFVPRRTERALLQSRRWARARWRSVPGESTPIVRQGHRCRRRSFSWLSVLYWGRMLPFIGDAF